jgi:hypothetical protein
MRILALLLIASAAHAQAPPLEMKGVPLGAPKQDVITTIPGMECRGIAGPNVCYLLTTSVVTKGCPPSASAQCIKEGFERLKFGPAITNSYWVDLRDDKVARIRVQFGMTQFGPVVVALTEKYGAPSSDVVDEVQNRMGAKFRNRIVKWDRPDGLIRARERGPDIDTSDVTMETKEYAAATAAESTEKAKASAKAL